ncbi:hypothetical protein [Terriglobus roseus]|uniref:Sporulation related domain-containing protein n=1 Tax=Terriglobus roseus TaxID=392734 RepID=A0A1H4JRA2_9BACT|nr:hypothetical protein [Terriglobus roseus]SEB48839.1 hypothetical protein SAMN05443244_0773 [Terriglobus roseus]
MHLWTEYEGTTLAGYPLRRLHRSEGRNAFFLTTTPEGQAAILRLTEAHFDETELLGRWTKIAAVSHPNLQGILQTGRTTYDSVPLAFCLIEPIDESLSDVLRDRVLSSGETKDVAEAVAGALAALHAAGLVHEHIDATNVFAMGETVKLRCDCARECTGDFEADTPEAREALRQADVHDLGLLLLRCLTVDWQGTIPAPLPSPFDKLIPRLLEGTLTAEGLVAMLNPPPVVVPAARPITTGAAAATLPRETGLPMRTDEASETPVYSGMPKPVGQMVLPVVERRNSMGALGEVVLQRFRPMNARPIGRKVWIASGTAAAMLGLVLWNTARDTKHPAAAAQTTVAENASRQTAPALPRKGAASATKPSAIPERRPTQESLVASGMQAGWHVIAYTYNYEQQAQAKAEQLRRKYVALQPQVFSPTGHAPYFVALGGPSDSVSALALRNHARQVGLPRDTYARNF